MLSFCVFLSMYLSTPRAALGRVCIKLVVVMGITWILDVLSWIHTTLDGDRHAFWIVSDLINALHGVFIFMVVGCQPQVNKYKQNIYLSPIETIIYLRWNWIEIEKSSFFWSSDLIFISFGSMKFDLNRKKKGVKCFTLNLSFYCRFSPHKQKHQHQVLMAIKRFWSLKVGRSTANTANGPQHSSSSHGLPSIGESVTNNTFTNNSFTTTTTKVPLETVCWNYHLWIKKRYEPWNNVNTKQYVEDKFSIRTKKKQMKNRKNTTFCLKWLSTHTWKSIYVLQSCQILSRSLSPNINCIVYIVWRKNKNLNV